MSLVVGEQSVGVGSGRGCKTKTRRQQFMGANLPTLVGQLVSRTRHRCPIGLLTSTLVFSLLLVSSVAQEFDAVAAYKTEKVQKALERARTKLSEEHEHVMPPSWVHAGVVYKGGNWRLRRVLLQAAAGHPIHIGLVGGSISCAADGIRTYQHMFVRRLQRLFPASDITHKNGCTAGTGSALAATCTSTLVQPDAGLVFVEFALNDGFSESVPNPKILSMERLVRKLMRLPLKPAVVLLNVYSHGQAFWRNADPELELGKLPFYKGPDDQYGLIAQYYGANWLSLRDASWKLCAVRNGSHNFSDIFTGDFIHPNQRGHVLMADIAMAMVQQTLGDLIVRPYTEQDEEELKRPLDPPIFDGNYDPTTVTCAFGSSFPAMVQSHEGWEFVNEGRSEAKPKWGFVTTTINATLLIKVQTTAEGSGEGKRMVSVGYLKSYEHMGKARIACVSGCQCEEKILDAHDAVNHESQTYMANMVATAAPECFIAVTTLPESSSGEHKFKVNGVMVTWDTDNTGFHPDTALNRYDHE